jgi:peptidyl-prolyl cis-trans isomerase SurA
MPPLEAQDYRGLHQPGKGDLDPDGWRSRSEVRHLDRLPSVIALKAAGFALVTLLADAVAPRTEVLDRIVAIVGDSPIFLSELRHRAKPHFFRVDLASGNDPVKKASERAEVLRQLLDRMIDEHLEEREADKAHLSVTPDEVDNGIKQIAAQTKLSPSAIMDEAKRQGMTEQDYRDEIRRQVLEGKLIQLRVRMRVQVTDADAKKAYDTFIKAYKGPDAPIELRIIVLKVGTGADAKKAAETLATQIAQKAKSGTDFCALVTQHTQDDATKSTCGSRGPTPPSALFPELAKVGGALEPGKTAAPLFFRDPSGGQAYLVIQRGPAVTVPTFESVKDQMKEKAFLETTERERKLWLDELHKGVYVDVRL